MIHILIKLTLVGSRQLGCDVTFYTLPDSVCNIYLSISACHEWQSHPLKDGKDKQSKEHEEAIFKLCGVSLPSCGRKQDPQYGALKS